MAERIFEPHGSSGNWAAGGAIDMNLQGKAFTTTAMLVVVRADITTTTPTNFNDYWDRLISRLTLSGSGRTYMDYSNMRIANHHARYKLGSLAPRRPTVIGSSQTNALQQFAYLFHFGVKPFEFNPLTGQLQYNPWDLSGGIPPTTKESLGLTGTFAPNSALGTNVTVNDGDVYVNYFGVREEAGDQVEDWMARAFPHWLMESPTLDATTTAFNKSTSVPSGDFLQRIVGMLTAGANAPRDDAVLNSLRLKNGKAGRDVFTFGGQAAAAADYKVAELFSGLFAGGAPASDDGVTLGVPSMNQVSDKGLFVIPVHRVIKARASEAQRVYGMDIRNLNTGDLKLEYGVANATGVTMNLLYEKYQLNPEHPANAGI